MMSLIGKNSAHIAGWLLFFALFCVLFAVLQECLKPKFCDESNNSTSMIEGFYALYEDSLDALFLGGSQMAYAVAADALTIEHGISSYDFGANGQMPETTLYYLKQAFRRQHPRLVLLEVGQLFDTNRPDDAYFAWNMSSMPFGLDKWRHLLQLTRGDYKASFMHLFPLFQYHSRWKELNRHDARLPFVRRECASRGHLACSSSNRVSAPAGGMLMADKAIPDSNMRCLAEISLLCKEKGSRLILFKTPSVAWNVPDQFIMRFAEDNGIQYWNFNGDTCEMGLDFDNDFVDAMHLNAKGARKFTAFLAKRLKH